MVFHWSLSDSKSPQVSRTLLAILAVLSNAVVWIVSIHPPTSKSSRPFNNPLVIVPKAPITIGTIVTFMFHSFFNSVERSRDLLGVFQSSNSWWAFVGVWTIEIHRWSPELFLVFLLTSAVLHWFRFSHWFPISSIPFSRFLRTVPRATTTIIFSVIVRW